MKKIAFSLYVFALVIMLPTYVIVELNSTPNNSSISIEKKADKSELRELVKVKIVKDANLSINIYSNTAKTNSL